MSACLDCGGHGGHFSHCPRDERLSPREGAHWAVYGHKPVRGLGVFCAVCSSGEDVVAKREIAAAVRAAVRDNAVDRVSGVYQLEVALDRRVANDAASIAVEALAGWLAERGEVSAAALLRETSFTSS